LKTAKSFLRRAKLSTAFIGHAASMENSLVSPSVPMIASTNMHRLMLSLCGSPSCTVILICVRLPSVLLLLTTTKRSNSMTPPPTNSGCSSNGRIPPFLPNSRLHSSLMRQQGQATEPLLQPPSRPAADSAEDRALFLSGILDEAVSIVEATNARLDENRRRATSREDDGSTTTSRQSSSEEQGEQKSAQQ